MIIERAYRGGGGVHVNEQLKINQGTENQKKTVFKQRTTLGVDASSNDVNHNKYLHVEYMYFWCDKLRTKTEITTEENQCIFHCTIISADTVHHL